MELIGARSGRRVLTYFVVAVLIGSLLLWLPQAASTGTDISYIDALFTSTSAVCVTGLAVRDTGSDFSLFGQIVILLLIQLGGIGVQTFGTAVLLSLGLRLRLSARHGLAESYDAGMKTSIGRLLLAVIATTLAVELAGCAILFAQFVPHMPLGEAAFTAVFHAVSAFCNAGFSTFDTSLERFNLNYVVLLSFSVLIIIGGLGFVVIREVYARMRNRQALLSLHSKLCLVMTAILMVAGMVLIAVAEKENAFAGKSIWFTAVHALFQSVTARTAGFNALPQTNLTDLTILLTIILMFIGACPGSTGGGIKTTTLAVILMLAWNRFRGRQHVSGFRRTISADSVSRALTVLVLAIFVIAISLVLFMFAEEISMSHTFSRGWFVENLFEVVSAFGTVGLSLGMTESLHSLGKVWIILLMFTGRVGLLTLALTLARPRKKGEIIYREENVLVG